MSTSDAGSASDHQDPPTPLPASHSGDLAQQPAALPRPRAVWAWALAAGAVVALASWLNGEFFYNHYKPSLRSLADPYSFQALNREQAVADGRNTALAYGFLASALGVALGLAGGMAGRSVVRGLVGATSGALLGGVAAAGLAFLLMPVFRARVVPESTTTLVPFLVHGAIWLAAGAGGGLAFGAGLGGRSTMARCLGGGMAGALIGTAVYELVVDLAFPMERFDDLIGPTALTRLLAFASVALFVALGSAVAAALTRGHAVSPTPLPISGTGPERSPAAPASGASRHRRLKHAWMIVLPVLLAIVAWHASHGPPQVRLATQPSRESSAGVITAFDDYARMIREFEKLDVSTALAVESARTDAERLAGLMRRRSDRAAYARRFLELAEHHAREPGSIESLVWVIANAPSSPEATSAIDLLERDYLESENLGPACEQLTLLASARAETVLRAIARKNPAREIQATAQLGLARSLASRSERAAQGATSAAADLSRDAEAIFELVIARYPGESAGQESMAEAAAHELFALRALGIGKVAPEIDGNDLDGKPMKLSDHRGRVVVLEFWGHW